MPQIVPAEVLDAGTLQGFPPGARIGIRQRLPGIREYPLRVLTQLPSQDSNAVALSGTAMGLPFDDCFAPTQA